MEAPVWKEKYSVHVEEIDAQHKRLFDIIGKTITVYESKNKDLFPVLKELTDYVKYHFSTENKYMLDYHFPDFLAHNHEHQQFTLKVGDFLDKFEKNKPELALEIINFTKDWYISHILGTDKKMGEFLKAKMADK